VGEVIKNVMHIKTITVSELEEFIRSGEYLSFDTIPITPVRAHSQLRNPHAKPGDPALWLALDDSDNLLGFIGSLPATDYRTGKRMGWNSCWWVDPEKGRDAAMTLFYHFLKYWDMQVAFSDMTINTFSIVDQMDFCHLREEQIFTGYIRFSFKESFLSQKKLPYPLAPLAALIIPVINGIQYLRVSLAGENLRRMELELKENPDDEVFKFIEKHQEGEFSQRKEPDFEWIFNGEWLTTKKEDISSRKEKYPFSWFCEHFEWKWIITRLEGEINSVMLTSLRDHTLKVLYFYGNAPGFAMMAIKSMVSRDPRIRRIIFSHPKLIKNTRMLNSFLILKRLRKRYLGISKKILKDFPANLIMQLGDGDAVFT